MSHLMGQCGIEHHNESFNGTVWNRATKTTCVLFTQFQIGVFDAIAHFNIGKKFLLLIYEKLGMKPGYFTTIGCSKLNNACLVTAYKASCEVRINRFCVT